jgi:ribonuclease VapC
VILDSSAVVALFMAEPDCDSLIAKLGAARMVGIGTPTLVEAGLVLSARLKSDVGPMLGQFLTEFAIQAVPFGDHHWREAIDAYRRFGKGRHPAALNFGDCLSYATAKLARQPLLCTGRDFARTDLQIA